MTFTFWTESTAAVVEPRGQQTFQLLVRREGGQLASNVKLTVAVSAEPEGATFKAPRFIQTSGKGIASLPLHAGETVGKFIITVSVGKCCWIGTLFVTAINIPYAPSLNLTAQQEQLLRMLYWDKQRLQVLRTFGGGMSGSAVLQVQATDLHGRNAKQVVKIGPRDAMGEEGKNYLALAAALRENAARVEAYAEFGLAGAIVYADAGESSALEAVKPFTDFYTEREPEEIAQAIFAVLGRGLPKVYAQHEVKPFTLGQLVHKFMPEHLVVSLAGGQGGCGVYRTGETPKLSAKIKKLTSKDIEHIDPRVAKSDLIVLAGFRISKMQDGDLNLEDSAQERYKVKVRYDGAKVAGFTSGDTVDIVARVVTNREERMKFAVGDCLQRFGLKRNRFGYELAGENYPDPLSLLSQVLAQPCDTALGIIHGDLHWDNVMLESPSNWRLIDYGLTGSGPILFDYIKLETYLRLKVLSRDSSITPTQLLEFERALVNNPIGRLADAPPLPPVLAKAADAIRTIRRLARPYLRNDFFDYIHFLFAYALALAKYYPAPEQWETVKTDAAGKKKCENLSREFFYVLAPVLVLGRLIKWNQVAHQRRDKPADFPLSLHFVGHGETLIPKPDMVSLDVGNASVPGVIDHHFKGLSKDSSPRCTAQVVWQQPELVSQHVGLNPVENVTWVTHTGPDFDAVASTYLAWHLACFGFFPPGAAEIGEVFRAGGCRKRISGDCCIS